MALSFTASKSNIKRRYYTVYMRSTGTAITSSNYDTLVNWNTFLGLFDHIGYCENKNVKVNVAPDDPVEIDGGEVLNLGKKGTTEIKMLQSEVADKTAMLALEAEDADMLLVDDTNNKFMYIHDKRFNCEQVISSGEVENWMIRHEQNISSHTDYIHTEAAIPTS